MDIEPPEEVAFLFQNPQEAIAATGDKVTKGVLYITAVRGIIDREIRLIERDMYVLEDQLDDCEYEDDADDLRRRLDKLNLRRKRLNEQGQRMDKQQWGLQAVAKSPYV